MKEIKTADNVWSRIDRIARPFFPPKSRKYISLPWMTVFALCIFAIDLILKLVIATPRDRNRVIAAEQAFHSPIFLVPYDITLLLILFFLFASKPNPEYEYLRALIFGIVLAAILGQILILLFPGSLHAIPTHT